MISQRRRTLAALTKAVFFILLISIAYKGASTQESREGFLKKEELKGDGTPNGWKKNQDTYWKDIGDSVEPTTPGCHVETDSAGNVLSNGRFFGEFCGADDGYLRETTPGIGQVHKHENDIGEPWVVDCNIFCGEAGKGGFCTKVDKSAKLGFRPVPPCATSAICYCFQFDCKGVNC